MNDRIITSPSAVAQLTSQKGDTIEEVTLKGDTHSRMKSGEWRRDSWNCHMGGSPGVHVEPLVLSGFAASSGNRDRISFVLTGNEASPSHSFSDNSRAEKTCLSGKTHINVIEK